MNCFVCHKHQTQHQGLVLPFDDFPDFVVAHAPDRTEDQSNYIGALIIEPKRHLKNWAELSDNESTQLGLLMRAVNRILYQQSDIAHVYNWVFGDAVEHFHIWLVPRYQDTEQAYWGVKFSEAPNAPKGGETEMIAFITKLKEQLVDE
ncbi:HIT family protein [Vibrio sonorensis]|uniref:HIT family protein n=1 Tax=Vibrio sonorensis TaxID=1004316 RepID=UPI000ADFAE93|nr:hypothetical protein [Vibrio sonorensis]